MEQSLESQLVDQSPDFIVVLSGDLRVTKASAGLRSAVPQLEPGADFCKSLDAVSEARLRQAFAFDHAVTRALNLELVHRGRERMVVTAWRFFRLERSQLAGIGRETAHGVDLAGEVDALKRRYQETVSQLASLTGRLRELAMSDSLTGVLNRRAFLDHGASEWVRQVRHQHVLSCAMLDVDGFKKINDSFGHAVGDSVLQHIGAVLRATLRGSDLPARLGGDEFVALMPETTMDGAYVLGERLLSRVMTRSISVLDQSIHATLSIGVATSDGCDSLDELLAHADQALYKAKEQGRARVVRFA